MPGNTPVFIMPVIAFILMVSGCIKSEENLHEAQIVQLQAENTLLKHRVGEYSTKLAKFQDSKFGLIRDRVVTEPAEFKADSDTLNKVRERGLLRCGGNSDLPGIGYLSSKTFRFEGFDIDLCKAIAVAVFGAQGTSQVRIIPLSSKRRFSDLQTGSVDVLIRNTTWSLSRDVGLGLDFAGISFYDGQGLMARVDSDIMKISNLKDKTVCAVKGTTSIQNIELFFKELGIPVEMRLHADRVAAQLDYDNGFCDAYTGDKISLVVQRTLMTNPDEHRILEESMSREPLGPVVRHGDEHWKDVINWTLQCLLNAELLNVNQRNVDVLVESDLYDILHLLGKKNPIGEALGLSNDFCYQIIKQVGNYEDVFNNNLGPYTEYKLLRGENALYVDGGLHYPLPFR